MHLLGFKTKKQQVQGSVRIQYKTFHHASIYGRPVQHTARGPAAREGFSCGPRGLSQLLKMLQKLGLSNQSFFSEYCITKQDFFGPRKIYVDQFGPSSFLSCAGLVYSVSFATVAQQCLGGHGRKTFWRWILRCLKLTRVGLNLILWTAVKAFLTGLVSHVTKVLCHTPQTADSVVPAVSWRHGCWIGLQRWSRNRSGSSNTEDGHSHGLKLIEAFTRVSIQSAVSQTQVT